MKTEIGGFISTTKHRKSNFNLVEIALAIAVVGLGLAGIMALFPIGLSASRDSVADNYSANFTKTLIAYISYSAEADWTGNIQGYYPGGKPDSDGGTEGTSPNPETTNWVPAMGATASPPNGLFIHKTEAGLFRVYQSSENVVDFSAAIRVWKQTIEIGVYNPSSGIFEHERIDNNTDNYDNAAGLHFELSWPVQKPYDQRDKRYYYYELFNRN